VNQKGNWEPVQNVMEERCNMVVFSMIAQQPGKSIEDRLQEIQETLRYADQQTDIFTDFLDSYDSDTSSRLCPFQFSMFTLD